MRKPLLTALAVLCGLLTFAPLASAARSLTLGFVTYAPERSSDLKLAAGDGASLIRVNVAWASVAPATRSRSFKASNPLSPGYNWSGVDEAVQRATAHRLTVAMTIYNAPTWAEGAHRPSSTNPGSWRVKASDYGQFATAIARRYSGKFPEPGHHGKFLPRVRIWQAWNEPNLDYYFSPQWIRGANHHWKEVAPAAYRSLLNAFYAAVKRVSSSNRVIMAGTAPYGDLPGTDPLGRERTPPVAFYRDVFCLSNALKPSCSSSVHLDGVDHHPYNSPTEGPEWAAQNKDDASYVDIHKITRVLRAGVASHHVLPHGHKTLWATEMGWTSSPPTSGGVPVAKDALWYEQAFYVLWKQGVDTVMPTEIRDTPPSPNVFQDGLYFHNGKPKRPIIAAYRFPFVTQRRHGSSVEAWGRAPKAGHLAIQIMRGGQWKTLRKLSAGRHKVFSVQIKLAGSAKLRATIGSQTSLTWTQAA